MPCSETGKNQTQAWPRLPLFSPWHNPSYAYYCPVSLCKHTFSKKAFKDGQVVAEVEMSQQTNASKAFYWTKKSIRLHSQKLMEVQWQEVSNDHSIDQIILHSCLMNGCLLSDNLTPNTPFIIRDQIRKQTSLTKSKQIYHYIWNIINVNSNYPVFM